MAVPSVRSRVAAKAKVKVKGFSRALERFAYHQVSLLSDSCGFDHWSGGIMMAGSGKSRLFFKVRLLGRRDRGDGLQAERNDLGTNHFTRDD